jgi:hypothetical protein
MISTAKEAYAYSILSFTHKYLIASYNYFVFTELIFTGFQPNFLKSQLLTHTESGLSFFLNLYFCFQMTRVRLWTASSCPTVSLTDTSRPGTACSTWSPLPGKYTTLRSQFRSLVIFFTGSVIKVVRVKKKCAATDLLRR